MLEEFTAEDFSGLTGQAFRLRHDQLPVSEATLLEVEKLSERTGPSGRTPFSLLFACRTDSEPVQTVFDVEHERLGRLPMFLVPVGKDERGLLLEAVFT